MREPFLLINPGVGHICNFPEQRKLITTEGGAGFPALVGLIDSAEGYPETSSRFGLVTPNGSLYFSEPNLVNRFVVLCHRAPRFLAENRTINRSRTVVLSIEIL